MTDIVERLRDLYAPGIRADVLEAADEIEQLQTEIHRLCIAIESIARDPLIDDDEKVEQILDCARHAKEVK